MKIERNIFVLILILAAIFLANCTTETPSNPNAGKPTNTNAVPVPTPTPIANVNANTANSNVAASNSGSPTVANANSPTAVITNYYNALQRNDEAALRKTLSEDAIKEWEMDMKASGFKTVAETINDYGDTTPPQVKSEKIDGNVAILETVDSETKISGKIELVREGNDWKIVPPSRLIQINTVAEPKADSK